MNSVIEYQKTIISMLKHMDNPAVLERIYNLTIYLYLQNKKAVPDAPTSRTEKTEKISRFNHTKQ